MLAEHGTGKHLPDRVGPVVALSDPPETEATIESARESSGTVLIADDDPLTLEICQRLLEGAGYRILTAADGREAIAAGLNKRVDVVLCDVQMPGADGFDVLETLQARKSRVSVVMMTSHATVEAAVRAVKQGAYDYLTKPFNDLDRVRITISKALERKRLIDRAMELERRLDGIKEEKEKIIGQSEAIRSVKDLIDTVAYSDSNIFVLGASGTGKELVARAIHRKSRRRDKPFIAVNCSALTDTLFESELFGHEKGAFTGAQQAKDGLLEKANGGTIFLDEIGDMSPLLQAKLLRALQDGEIRRVGGTHVRYVDVRVIAATNRPLEKLVKEGKFREDLYYRLNVIRIDLPSLKERRSDVSLLAYAFLKKYRERFKKKIGHIAPEVLELLSLHDWPGNVRELENTIEHACVVCHGASIGLGDLPRSFISAAGAASYTVAPVPEAGSVSYKEAKTRLLEAFNRRYCESLLKKTGGHVTKAAAIAGMDRSNFRKIISEADLDPNEFKAAKR